MIIRFARVASLIPKGAGRIHRLGQTKDVLVTRFCFRDSIDEATTTLHEKFKSNDLQVDADKRLGAVGVRLLTSM
jgi:hypothetical protein